MQHHQHLQVLQQQPLQMHHLLHLQLLQQLELCQQVSQAQYHSLLGLMDNLFTLP